MASVTALELVNRVLRRVRDETVSGFGDQKSATVLDMVNAAKEDVLTSRDWHFDLRHDGALTTRGPLESSTSRLTRSSVSMTDAALFDHSTEPATTPPAYVGNIITRFEYLGDTDTSKVESSMSNSIWRIRTLQGFAASGLAQIDFTWPGVTTTTAKVKYFVAEYLLPDTVREVVSVTQQNGNALALEHIDPGATFDNMFPSMARRYATPEWVGIGGFDHGTRFPTQVTDAAPMLRMVLYPVPDDEYRLSYSYYYQHPELVNATDKLTGPPPDVVSSIVEKAAADYVLFTEQRVQEGTLLASGAERRLDRKFASSDAQPARRHIVGSWSGGGRRRTVKNGFPGVTIEG